MASPYCGQGRLRGLFQFKTPAQRGNLKADVVLDLSTTVRPGAVGYPLNAARDGFLEPARWTFEDLVEEVERENESVGRSDEDEILLCGAPHKKTYAEPSVMRSDCCLPSKGELIP